MSKSKIFIDLPAEIQMSIVLFLDYFALISLSQTNLYFHRLITQDHIKDALLDLELRTAGEDGPLDFFKEHLLEGQSTKLSTHLPCYKCLRGLPTKSYFLPSHTTGNYSLNEKSASKRKCTGCYYHCRATWLTDSELFCAEGVVFIDCARCKMTKRFVQNVDLSNLAWLRGKCCFDCYWADHGTQSGEINVVKFETQGRQKMHVEIPIAREELKGLLTRSYLGKIDDRATADMTG